MLIDFTIENYRSIKAPQTLSLLATNAKEHPSNYFSLRNEPKIQLLKSTVIYGPNASGKSNIIKALKTMLKFIFLSTDLKLDQPIPYYDPFKFSSTGELEPTKFSFEFLVKDIRHRYSIAFNKHEILEEELYYYPKKIQTKLFIRGKGESIDFGTSLIGPKKSIEEQLLKNVLFLSKAANSNNTTLQTIYRELVSGFIVDFDSCTSSDTLLDRMTSMVISKGDAAANDIIKFMKKVDDSIFDIKIEKIDQNNIKLLFGENTSEEAKKTILDSLCYEAKFSHKINDNRQKTIDLELKDESAGTIKAFNLAGFIIISLHMGATLVIDELNNSFHPIISRFIIDLFNNKKSNPHNAQLIFTTHDTHLLDPSLFRRDQIWFTEKNQAKETQLYSLSEFDYKEVRHNIPFEKWYLSGKFGAIPIVNDFDMSFKEDTDAQTESTD